MKTIVRTFLICICLFQAMPGNPCSITYSGIVVRIIDGDTFDLLTSANRSIRVRMYGIDCPERRQDYYRQAKDALAALLYKKTATVYSRGYDRNRRLIGTVFCNKQHINLLMIRKGYAWHFRKYSGDEEFTRAEDSARAEKSGLWRSARPVAPWDFRATKKKTRD